jgi:transcriptional regulator with XRE-family HTH domain
MEQTPITPRSCELGDALRSLRKQFAKGSAFAEQLDWDPSKVSNIERGKVRPTEVDLAQYLTACGKDRSWITEFSNNYTHAFQTYFAQEAANFSTVTFAERTAAAVTGYGRAAIPDLLRTIEYTENLLLQRGASPEQVQAAIQSQHERQRMLHSTARPSFLFYVAEMALKRRCEDARKRMDQLELLRRMSRFLRIIPASEKLSFSTDFTVYEHEKAPTTVVVECEFAKVFIQDGIATSQCQTVLAALNDVALSHTDSRGLLSQLLAEEYVAGIKAATDDRPAAS